MWLFPRRQVELGMVHAKRGVNLVEARITGAREMEITGAVPTGTLTIYRPLLMLKLGPGGEGLSVVTQCTCTASTLCQHAVAVLVNLDTAPGQAAVMGMARPGPPSDGAEAHPWQETEEGAAIQRIEPGTPRPILRLKRMTVELPQLKMGRRALSGVFESIGVALPLVRYEECPEIFPILPRGSGLTKWQNEDGSRFSMQRSLGMERLFIPDLTQFGLAAFAEALPDARAQEPTASLLSVPKEKQALFWARFLRDLAPMLRNEDWTVEIAEDFGFELKEAADESWFTDLAADADGKDSFSLDLGIDLGGQRVSLVPVLVHCIDQGLTPEILEQNLDQGFLLALPGEGNPVLSLPARRLLVLLKFLHELVAVRPSQKDGKLHLDRLRAAQLQSLDGLPIRAPAELAALRERLKHFTEVSQVAAPEGLKAALRPYQQEGLSWLQFLREFGLHGVLADDMGLGKTVQTLAHLLAEKEAGRMDRPSLIIAPTSLLRNWAREAAKFAPALHVLLLHGEERRSDFSRIRRYDLVITSYPLLVRDAELLLVNEWHLVVLDEAQNIKNPKSRAAQEAARLKARHRLCLTGTPMENHLGELWSLFQFLMPGLLGDAAGFREYYRNPIEKDQDADRQKELAGRLQPLMLRRTKSSVAKDLPPKTEILHTIELGKAQEDLYATIRAVVDQRVREAISAQGLERSQIVVLDALLKLRQVCCHPNLVKAESARGVTESAKTNYLMEELLPELLEEGHRVLIFSQFTEMLAIIEQRVKSIGAGYVKLTGETKDRETPMRRFQKGEVPIFLISLKAGGVGLNLTTADTVIHYDPWWNPAAEAQASDRAHRIGQTKPVFIHKLICQGTIEERIVEMQKSKAALIEGLLTGRAEGLKLTPEDLQRLMAA